MRVHPLKRVEAATEAAELAVGEAIVAWLRRRGWACGLGIHDWQPCRVSFVFAPDTYYPMERCRECMRLRPSSGAELGTLACALAVIAGSCLYDKREPLTTRAYVAEALFCLGTTGVVVGSGALLWLHTGWFG